MPIFTYEEVKKIDKYTLERIYDRIARLLDHIFDVEPVKVRVVDEKEDPTCVPSYDTDKKEIILCYPTGARFREFVHEYVHHLQNESGYLKEADKREAVICIDCDPMKFEEVFEKVFKDFVKLVKEQFEPSYYRDKIRLEAGKRYYDAIEELERYVKYKDKYYSFFQVAKKLYEACKKDEAMCPVYEKVKQDFNRIFMDIYVFSKTRAFIAPKWYRDYKPYYDQVFKVIDTLREISRLIGKGKFDEAEKLYREIKPLIKNLAPVLEKELEEYYRFF